MGLPKGIVLLLLLASSSFAQHDREVTVCLQLKVAVPPDVLALSRVTASSILERIGIGLRWTCPLGLKTHDPKRLIFVQIVDQTPRTVSGEALAYSFPYKRDGVRVAVFYDRLEIMIANQPISGAFVLGHVFAHEIGHVLSGVAQHAKTGVMQAHWTSDDMAAMRMRPLQFTAEDGEQIRQNLHLMDAASFR